METQLIDNDIPVFYIGTYKCITLKNYVNDPTDIEKAFQMILQQPGLDPNGYCIEWYLNEKDVKCMVRNQSR